MHGSHDVNEDLAAAGEGLKFSSHHAFPLFPFYKVICTRVNDGTRSSGRTEGIISILLSSTYQHKAIYTMACDMSRVESCSLCNPSERGRM
jgi:hypothetical protein